MGAMRWSQQAIDVMGIFTSSTAAEFHGYGIAQLTGIAPKTVYDILNKFGTAGWLEWREESIYPGRPPKCLYRITDEGMHNAVGKVNA